MHYTCRYVYTVYTSLSLYIYIYIINYLKLMLTTSRVRLLFVCYLSRIPVLVSGRRRRKTALT